MCTVVCCEMLLLCAELNDEQLKEYQKVGEIKVEGYMLSANDLKVGVA